MFKESFAKLPKPGLVMSIFTCSSLSDIAIIASGS